MSETILGHWFRVGIRRSPALRSIVRSRPVQRLIMTTREARAVHESVPFAGRELMSSRAASYRPRLLLRRGA